MNGLIELTGPHGRVKLRPEGGMIGPARFNLPGVGSVSPLVDPDWRNDHQTQTLLPLMRNLCGDFVCAPYGAPGMNADLPEKWRVDGGTAIKEDGWFHGNSVNALWEISVDPSDKTRGVMVCNLPEPHPFSQVCRTVSLLPEQGGYQADLCITARSAVAFPLSLHPCFFLPEQPGALRLEVFTRGAGWTYPVAVVPEHAPIAVDACFERLEAVPLLAGGTLDMTQLPPASRCEALLQIAAPLGKVRLVYEPEGYAVTFEYDGVLLPSLVLWISNRGRDEVPFSGRFRTIGVEAVAGAFDLGPQISTSPQNPIAKEGLSTCINLRAGEQLRTTSVVRVEALQSSSKQVPPGER